MISAAHIKRRSFCWNWDIATSGFFCRTRKFDFIRNACTVTPPRLLDAGIAPDAALIIGGAAEDSFASRELRLTNLLARTNRPTAMLVASDDHALYLMRTLRRLGLRAPEDVSLVGFNDSAFSQHSDPPLTTVKIDMESMGRLAVQRLVARIRAPNDSFCYPAVNVVSTSLVVRGSCRKLK